MLVKASAGGGGRGMRVVRDLSELTDAYERYAASGEINSTVADAAAVTEVVRERFVTDATVVDELDGLFLESKPEFDWHPGMLLETSSWLTASASRSVTRW